MTGVLFLAFVALTAVVLVALIARYLSDRTAFRVFAALTSWLLYVGLLAGLGVVRNPALRPPGIAYILLPVFLFVLFFAIRSSAGAHVALAFPLWVLLAMQVYRAGVELFLHRLWIDSLVPKMLTFQGANVDILVGASAPLIAWTATKGSAGIKLAFVWSVLGLASLANVVLRSAMTVPGPFHILHSEIPNLAIGTFPFTYIAGFFAPLAVVLHVLAIRSLRRQLSAAAPLLPVLPREALR